MPITLLAVVGSGCVIWCIWTRRNSWHCRWEAASSLTIGLAGIGLLLESPASTRTVGPPLHDIFGIWNGEHFAGDLLLLGAMFALVYNTVVRIEDDDTALRHYKLRVELPGLAVITTLAVLFYQLPDVPRYGPDFLAVHGHNLLDLYLIVFCTFAVYLMGYAVLALIELRQQPASKRIATAYLGATSLGILASTLIIVDAVIGKPIATGWVTSLLGTFALAAAAIACGLAWKRKHDTLLNLVGSRKLPAWMEETHCPCCSHNQASQASSRLSDSSA